MQGICLVNEQASSTGLLELLLYLRGRLALVLPFQVQSIHLHEAVLGQHTIGAKEVEQDASERGLPSTCTSQCH